MLIRLSAPAAPFSVDDLKEELGIGHDEDDGMLERLIERATGYLDGPAGIMAKALVSQQWSETRAKLERSMKVGLGPLISVDSVKYFDADDVEQTLSSSLYRVYPALDGFEVELKQDTTIPVLAHRKDAVKITFTAGYGAGPDVPEPILGAISMLAGHFYENPTESSPDRNHPIVVGAFDLIEPFRNRK